MELEVFISSEINCSKCCNKFQDQLLPSISPNTCRSRYNETSFSISSHAHCHICMYEKKQQVRDVLTTSHGHPVDDKTCTLTLGERGPVLLQDFIYLDEMAHFDRERIPERVVHAKGAGGWGLIGHHVLPSYYNVVTSLNYQKKKKKLPTVCWFLSDLNLKYILLNMLLFFFLHVYTIFRCFWIF